MLRALLRTAKVATLLLASGAGCSVLIDASEYVSAGTEPGSAAGAPSEQAGGGSGSPITPSFAVVAGQRDDIRNLGALATDVTLGGFDQAGQLVLSAAWTLPAAGRYVSSYDAGRLMVFGDPLDSDDRDAFWTSDVLAGATLSPWRRASPPLSGVWFDAVVSATQVIAIASDVGDHMGSELSLLNLTELDAWRPAGVSLLTPRIRAKAKLCQGYLFVVGGEIRPEADAQSISNVESAAVTAQGVGPFTASAELALEGMPLTRTDMSLACGAGRLYVIGGDTEPFMESGSVQVLSGSIESDGTVQSWHEEKKLLYPVGGAAAVVASSRLIVAGGYNATRLDAVSFAELDEAGHVLEWRSEGNPVLPVPVRDASAVSLEAQ